MDNFGKTSPILKKTAAAGTPAAGPNPDVVAAAVAAQTQQPLTPDTKPAPCVDCADCCKKDTTSSPTGYLDGKPKTTANCETNWYPHKYTNTPEGEIDCCCKSREEGPDPNAPPDCYLGVKATALTDCAATYGLNYRLKNYGVTLGYWCCKIKPVVGASPCIKGKKTSTGQIMTGGGEKVSVPKDCVDKPGTVAVHADDGAWWCCDLEIPQECGTGGYEIKTAETCGPAFIKKVIDGKSYCCPKDCVPGVAKTCPSGYKCDPVTKKCVFAAGQKGECGIGADGDRICEEKLGKGARCVMTGEGGQCRAASDVACPEGKGMEYPGCPCGKTYVSMTGNCVDLYILEAKTKGTTGWEGWVKGAAGRCDCISYCKATGCDEKCENCEAGLTFNWSPETQALLKRLMGRANYFLDYPSGYTPEQRNAIVNQALKGIKAKERGNIQGIRDVFGRQGLAGSGLQMERETQARREGRESVADAEASIAIQEENKRYQELAGTTGLAQNLLSLIMGAEQVPEAINAARRGENATSTAALLQFLATLMGSSQQGLGAILQAIMAQQPGMTVSPAGGNDWGDIGSWLGYILQKK